MVKNRVNPPEQLQTPTIKDVGLFRFLDQLKFIVFQLWKRTGAGADYINEVRTGLYEFDDIANLIESLKETEREVNVTDVDYQTIGNDYVVCTSNIIVSLNSEPEDLEKVTVKLTNGDVVISSSKKIDGHDSVRVVFADFQSYPSIELVYLLALDEWIIK